MNGTTDKRGIWWALVERKVSDPVDLSLMQKPSHEFRIEARVRSSHAPRRVNLQILTQRTTNYHSHLMEYDIPDTGNWHTISMTTHGFDAKPGDTIFGHMALMDWGPKDAYPYQTPVALEYDSGDYAATLDLALKAADYQGFEQRRREAAARGKLRGIGVATYIEACGIAPSAVVGSLGARAGLFEALRYGYTRPAACRF